jgi:hypothetical protein
MDVGERPRPGMGTQTLILVRHYLGQETILAQLSQFAPIYERGPMVEVARPGRWAQERT